MRIITGHVFFFNDTATTEIYTLSLHDALPIYPLFLWPQERIEPVVEAVAKLDVALTPREREFLRPEPERLLDELATPGLPHPRRREISTRLARLGDSRPGVGVVDDRPDVGGCEVPGDEPL